jgi:hypothetical protein
LFLRLFRLEQNRFAVKGEQIRWLMEEAIGIGAQRARLERWAFSRIRKDLLASFDLEPVRRGGDGIDGASQFPAVQNTGGATG